MSRIDITSSGTPLSDGMLQTANPLDATLQVVTDNVGNSSTVSLSTTETQINSILRIKTDNAELLDIENSSGNRFNINRDVQKVNLDFASNPTGSTSVVGAIRTFIDGVNLSDVAQFQENGQVTFTERVKLESDSTVTTQTSSVIQSSTTNASLVIAPNGTGALIASIPDGTATGGNARGTNSVDLQTTRTAATNIATGINSTISGGASNTASSNYSTVSGGQTNVASTGPYATVVGGQSNTSSSNGTISGGSNNTASGSYAIALGNTNSVSGRNSVGMGYSNTVNQLESYAFGLSNISSSQNGTAVGNNNTTSVGISNFAFGFQNLSNAANGYSIAIGSNTNANESYSTSFGYYSNTKLYGQLSNASGLFVATGDAQQSLLTARRSAALTTAATTVLSLDGTGVTNLIIPNGNNRAWSVQVNWVTIVTAITGTATGISVGDVVTSIDLLAFKRVAGTSSASAHTSAATKLMVTTPAAYAACAINYTAGASQEMALTFTGPTFVGGGSVTMRVVARVELTEVAFL